MAPTGLFLPPLGDASFRQLMDAYAQQVAGLEEAGVDLYVIETMISLSDARAAVLAVRAVTDKPIFVTFACDGNGRSISGTDITAALTVLQDMGIDAFGLNCMLDSGVMIFGGCCGTTAAHIAALRRALYGGEMPEGS